MAVVLDFEKPIVEIQKKIDELKKMSEASGMDLDNQIQTFEQQAQDYKIFGLCGSYLRRFY